MYRPWGSHCLLLPMVSSLYCLYVCSVVVAFICIKNIDLRSPSQRVLLTSSFKGFEIFWLVK